MKRLAPPWHLHPTAVELADSEREYNSFQLDNMLRRFASSELKYSSIPNQGPLRRAFKESVWRRRGSKCPICRCEAPASKRHLDHDHETDLVRGVICATCNTGIGMLKDDPKVVIGAFLYLGGTTKGRLVERRRLSA